MSITIKSVTGDILKSTAEALVNPVNCDGIMGRGLALQFRRAFPEMYTSYVDACKSGKLKPGRIHLHEVIDRFRPHYIINFPTKDHWWQNSRFEYIDAGLYVLPYTVKHYRINSLAIPKLGCGLGGLEWGWVKPMIIDAFNELAKVFDNNVPDMVIMLYE